MQAGHPAEQDEQGMLFFQFQKVDEQDTGFQIAITEWLDMHKIVHEVGHNFNVLAYTGFG